MSRTEKKSDTVSSGFSDTQSDLEELINIGKALSLERDTDTLLRSILMLSKKITGADAGSIFLVEEPSASGKRIRFKFSHTFSKDLAYEEFVMAFDKSSIAGYVAVTGEVLNIPDVYHIQGDLPYTFNRSYDDDHGYRSKSMLAVPMRNHLDQVTGVIQLINSKERKGPGYTGNEAFDLRLEKPADFHRLVVPFVERYEPLMEAVASQAAIALENNRLIRQIMQQFDEFVKASVTAIESQDPATSGHSERVAQICVALANAVNRDKAGAFVDVSFSPSRLKELELAGLLHDFGKVYIDPTIYLKGKKLYPRDLDLIKMRLALLHRTVELFYLAKERDLYRDRGNDYLEILETVQEEGQRRLRELAEIRRLIEMVNEPTLQDVDPDELLREIDGLSANFRFRDLSDAIIPILNPHEKENLAIKRGSLNAEERRVIEGHVNHTYTFVSKIPWPVEFQSIPDIVVKHHEKLDGSGYPQGLQGEDLITLPARMMTLADIFDALTAPDRPYKKSVPMERVLEILSAEAREGKLDQRLVDLFINQGLYKIQYRKRQQAV